MNLGLLLNFTKQELVDRYAGSLLGVIWTFIFPLVNILIFTLIFSKIMGTRLPGSTSTYGYSIYLVSGLITWNAFANTILRSANVFIDKSHIVTKVRIALPYLPLYIVLSESIIFLITLIFFFVFLWATDAAFSETMLLLPFIYILQQIFAYAIGLFFAIFNVFIRDIKEFVSILLQIWFWLTPIVYVPTILSESVKTWLDYNPVFFFVKAYQDIFMLGQLPDLHKLMIVVIIAHSLLIIAYLFFRKLEKDIRDLI